MNASIPAQVRLSSVRSNPTQPITLDLLAFRGAALRAVRPSPRTPADIRRCSHPLQAATQISAVFSFQFERRGAYIFKAARPLWRALGDKVNILSPLRQFLSKNVVTTNARLNGWREVFQMRLFCRLGT